MVQEFQVLRCFSCQTFQVHQVKKCKKWACKLCGEKQSLLKVYGQGSGADCRRHVQKLNLLQGEVEQAANSSALLNCQTEDHANEFLDDCPSPGPSQEVMATNRQASLWDSTSMIRKMSNPPQSGRLRDCNLSQSERVPMSRWNKYMEEESEVCVKQEEGDDMIYTDQSFALTAEARKRKELPEYGSDQNVTKGFMNVSKKNRSCEGWSAFTREYQPTCIKTEHESSIGQFERAVSHVAEPSFSKYKWNRFIPSEVESKQNASSAHRHQVAMQEKDLVLNHFQHELKTGPALKAPGDTSVPTKSLCIKGEICGPINERGYRLPGVAPSMFSSLPPVYSSIFQTDEDFDDNY